VCSNYIYTIHVWSGQMKNANPQQNIRPESKEKEGAHALRAPAYHRFAVGDEESVAADRTRKQNKTRRSICSSLVALVSLPFRLHSWMSSHTHGGPVSSGIFSSLPLILLRWDLLHVSSLLGLSRVPCLFDSPRVPLSFRPHSSSLSTSRPSYEKKKKKCTPQQSWPGSLVSFFFYYISSTHPSAASVGPMWTKALGWELPLVLVLLLVSIASCRSSLVSLSLPPFLCLLLCSFHSQPLVSLSGARVGGLPLFVLPVGFSSHCL
jgi:hypothetical protein